MSDGSREGWNGGQGRWVIEVFSGCQKSGHSKEDESKIKYREGFRPFAPSVKEELVSKYFDMDTTSPYMLLVAPVRKERRTPRPEGYEQ